MTDIGKSPILVRVTTISISLHTLLADQPRYMKERGLTPILISASDSLVELIGKREQCPHIAVPMTREITPLRDLYCLLLLAFHFWKHKPDIVHTHTPKAGFLGMIAAFICRVPMRIHTVAGLPVMTSHGWKKLLLTWIERCTYACAHHIWPNSPSLLQFIAENNWCPRSKLAVIAHGSTNGVDLQRFSRHNPNAKKAPPSHQHLPFLPDTRYIVNIARLVPDKGISFLVMAYQQIHLRYPNYKLLLIGSFESHDPLPRPIVSAIHNDQNICHIPWCDHVEYYLYHADFLVHPSLREGFPNVLLEAAAMHCPILCSDIPGNNDLVSHKHTGLLFAAKSSEAIVESLQEAIESRRDMQKMAERLYSLVQRRYPRSLVHQAIYDKYCQLLREIGKDG